MRFYLQEYPGSSAQEMKLRIGPLGKLDCLYSKQRKLVLICHAVGPGPAYWVGRY